MIQDNKLTAILQALTPGELEGLKGFLQWKVRHSEQYVIPLLGLLTRGGSRPFPDRESLHRRLFPGKPFREQDLYTAFSDLLGYTRTFLALESLERNPGQRDLLYIEELEHREVTPFLLEKKAYLRQWEKQPLRNGAKHLDLFLLHDAADRDFMKKQKREYDEALQEKINALDVFYFSTKLREACEVMNRHNIIGEKYSLRFIREIVEFTDAVPELASQPAIAVYATIWKMITTQQPEYFFGLKEMFRGQMKAFPVAEARNIVNYCLNYCIRRINTGEEDYLREAFDLYMFQLETQIIFDGRFMTQWDFKNIITVGIRLKKYDWTEKFIHDYKDRIEPAFRENAWNYNLANLYYEKREFRKAIRILNGVDFTDIYYTLSARSLLLKIYYEQEDFDSLISLADSFKTFLQRNQKMSAYQKTVHLNLVRFIRKAATLRTSSATGERLKKEVAKWQQRLAAETEVANIGWVKSVWEEMV